MISRLGLKNSFCIYSDSDSVTVYSDSNNNVSSINLEHSNNSSDLRSIYSKTVFNSDGSQLVNIILENYKDFKLKIDAPNANVIARDCDFVKLELIVASANLNKCTLYRPLDIPNYIYNSIVSKLGNIEWTFPKSQQSLLLGIFQAYGFREVSIPYDDRNIIHKLSDCLLDNDSVKDFEDYVYVKNIYVVNTPSDSSSFLPAIVFYPESSTGKVILKFS